MVAKITEYKVKNSFTVKNKLFVSGEQLFISDSVKCFNGTLDYRNIFSSDREYLGSISIDEFNKIKDFIC